MNCYDCKYFKDKKCHVNETPEEQRVKYSAAPYTDYECEWMVLTDEFVKKATK